MTEVDEFELVERGTPPTTVRPEQPVRQRRYGPWPWAVLAAALVLAGVWSAPTRPYPPIGVGTEQGPAWAMLAVDLTAPPSVEWSAEVGDLATAIPVLQRVGDVVILLDDVVAGYDAATGEELWSHDAGDETCTVTSRVVCTMREGGAGVITSIDPTTGKTETLAMPDAVYAIGVDGGLVVAADVDRGHLVRVDPGGEWLWDVPLDAAVHDSSDGGWSSLHVALTGNVLVVGGPLTYAVDVRTGEVMPDPARWSVWATPFGVTAEGVDGLGPVRYLIDPGGEVRSARSDGILLRVDDGIGADVRLEMNGPLLTASYTDDLTLWSVPDEAEREDRIATFAMARLGGVVVAAGVGDGVTVSGHDLITGEELWRLPEGSWPDTLAGSGSTLLRLDDEATLAAMDVRTGAELWRLGTGVVRSVAATDHGVVVLTDDTLTSWEWS